MLVFPFGVISVSRCSSCPFFLQVRPLIVRSFCKSVLFLSVISVSPCSSGRLFLQVRALQVAQKPIRAFKSIVLLLFAFIW